MARRRNDSEPTSADLVAEARDYLERDSADLVAAARKFIERDLPDPKRFLDEASPLPDLLAEQPILLAPRVPSSRQTEGTDFTLRTRPSRVPAPGPTRDPFDPSAERRTQSVRASIVAAVALLVAAAGAVALLSRVATEDHGSTPIGVVAVGQCFNEPSVTEAVEDVVIVDCAAPHELEVIGLPDAGGSFGDYPGEAAMFDWADERCGEVFEDYVGPEPPPEMGWISWIPTLDSWEAGDRSVLCLVGSSENGFSLDFTTGSARDAGRPGS